MNILRKLIKNHLFTPLAEDQELFLSLLNSLKSEWGKKDNINAKDKLFWLQIIENIRALALTPWNEDLGFRERQMADNLLWLSENKYPNKKIIVWMASVYSFKNRETINTLNPNLIYDDKDSFGDKLKQCFGNKVYTIGFTAASGKYGAFYWDSAPTEIGKSSVNSFENLFNLIDINFGFLNLEKLENSELWKNKQVISRPLGYSEMKAVWYNIFDGLFFIKTMKPSTERK